MMNSVLFVLTTYYTAFSCGSQYAIAQTDTIKLLKPVTIVADKFENLSALVKQSDIDSLTKIQFTHNNLADLLSAQSNVFIKNYGPASIATSSFRGGNANHTAVLWNGFNIQSPTLGLSDLSLIPVCIADEIKLLQGAQTVQWGSGALAGAIMLRNAFNNNYTNIVYGASFNSFNNHSHIFKYSYSVKKISFYINTNFTDAKNQYNFYNNDGYLSKQNHAEAKSYLLQPGLLIQLNRKQQLQIHSWLQYNNRNLPPTLLQEQSFANQTDRIMRICAEWSNKLNDKTGVFIRSAYFDETLIYNDSLSKTYSVTNTRKNINELEVNYKYKLQRISFIFNHTLQWANSAGYLQPVYQNSLSPQIFIYQNLFKNKLSNTFSIRKDFIQQYQTPWIFSNHTVLQICKQLAFNLSANRVYRLPSLNDLYWYPGGNPNLKPEKGYSFETGIKWQQTLNKFTASFSYSLFSRNIHDWIIWLPNTNYWSPQNIMQVWSRGAETESSLRYKNKKITATLLLNTSYVLSTNQKLKNDNDNSLGKQLIYTPMYSGFGKIILTYKKISFAYTANYTGYRYTSSDNAEYLPPYKVSNVFVSTEVKCLNTNLLLSLQINNLFNENYQVIINRPMPLRNYQINLQWKIANSKNHKI